MSRFKIYVLPFLVACTILMKYGVSVGGVKKKQDTHNPMLPTTKESRELCKSNSVAQMKLSAIAVTEEYVYVIINGIMLELGDKIGDYSVHKIEETSVILTNKNNDLITLRI